MKKIVFILLLINFSGFSQTKIDLEIIETLLNQQVESWNNGDIDTFMESYWKSDSLLFLGKNGVTYGWKSTLAHYKKSYPDKNTMGTLQFTLLKKDFHSPIICWIMGKWELTRPKKGDIGGYFTLIFKKIEGKWVIVSDHTS